MKVILTPQGLCWTYHTSAGRVYEMENRRIINDVGMKQDLGPNGFLEVPEGHFVVRATHIIDCYTWYKGDYLVADVYERNYMYRVSNQSHSMVMVKDCEVVADPWGVLGNPVEVQEEPQRTVSAPPPVPSYNSEGIKQVPALIKPDVLTSENKGIIKKQKAVAAEFLNKLNVINPAAILAGGSLRNWHFNRPANDLDFFVEVPNGSTGTSLKRALGILGVTDIFNMATHSAPGVQRDHKASQHQYDERMSDIHTVLEGKYQGETVQVIFTKVQTYCYIETHFDTSINMIWATAYENEGDYHLSVGYTQEWYATATTGVIFVYDNQCAYTNSHLEKVADYFPEAPLAHHRHLEDIVKDPSIASDVCQSWEDLLQEMIDEQNEGARTIDDFF